MPGALAQLPPHLLAMMAGGVSVLVASRDDRLRPSVMRAMGSRIDAAAGEVTVYLARRQAQDLLRDIARCGQVAAMFSQPSTHLSVQLKAARAQVRPATEADRPALDAYLAAMDREITTVGYAVLLARAMLSYRLDDLVAVTFVPEQVFEQTPGPRAGAVLAGGA
ncbi:hypothetical protein [Ramlibacter sp. PS4R-6]|uniref:hypothetical protein n=1 Tax=Ramlibacter sp. PS4R-6 TaxID=3133438 RepID=UPI0030A0F180